MTVYVVHCLAVKLHAVIRWTLAALRHRSAVALAIVETMIDVSVEMVRTVIPGTCSDENTA